MYLNVCLEVPPSMKQEVKMVSISSFCFNYILKQASSLLNEESSLNISTDIIFDKNKLTSPQAYIWKISLKFLYYAVKLNQLYCKIQDGPRVTRFSIIQRL